MRNCRRSAYKSNLKPAGPAALQLNLNFPRLPGDSRAMQPSRHHRARCLVGRRLKYDGDAGLRNAGWTVALAKG